MRTLFLIRHGMPDFPDGRRMCLGRTDMKLGALGRMQAAMLGAEPALRGVSEVFCSRLIRSRQTAEALGAPVCVLSGLEEMDAGAWDGLYFDDIKALWPELYARRGSDPSLSPPDAEPREHGRDRFTAAIADALRVSQGDIAVVAHASVMQAFLCTLLGLPLEKGRSITLPYGSYTRIACEDGLYYVGETGVLPRPEPDRALCERLLEASGVPGNVSRHCEAVAEEAMSLVCALAAAGCPPDEKLTFAGAYLHDVARTQPEHDTKGAEMLDALGLSAAADIVRQHHDLRDPSCVDPASVVYLADKLIKGEEHVTLAERFAASRERCVTAEAIAAHDRRLAQAVSAAAALNAACGKEVIALP